MTENQKYFVKNQLSIFLFTCAMIILKVEISIALILFFYFLIYIVGFNTVHRSICHKEFLLTRAGKIISAFLMLFMMLGDSIQFSKIHRYHHANSDKDNDPHSPYHGYFHAFVGWLIFKPKNNISLIHVKDLLKDDVLVFFMKHQTKIVWISLICLFVLSPILCLSLCLAMLLSWFVEMTCSTFVDHSKKFRKPNNVYIRSLLTFAPLHNDHHSCPYKTPLNDPGKYLIQFLKIIRLAK